MLTDAEIDAIAMVVGDDGTLAERAAIALLRHAREVNGLLCDLCEDSKAVAEVLRLRRAMNEVLSLIRSDDREGGGRAYRKSAPAKLTTIADSLRAALEGPRHNG